MLLLKRSLPSSNSKTSVIGLKRIEIDIRGRGRAIAELDDRNSRISEKLYQQLPIEANANLWGEEVYFEIPLEFEDENPAPDASEGDLSYWSPGSAICIFFGKTQPYSPVNHIGRIIEGLEIFKNVVSGDEIVLNKR
jgi:hypothetical protein